MSVKATTWVWGIVAAVAVGAPAQAEVFKDKSGVNLCTPGTSEEVMKRPDGSSVRKTAGACVSAADLPYPFDYRKSACAGMIELAADGKLVSQRGYCEAFSTKGDRYAYWYIYDPAANDGRTEIIPGSGTGAYAGIKGVITWKVKAPFPGGGSVIEWTGTWQTDGATASK